MMGLPAAVLTFGGLTVAVASDPETAERQGFRAGLKAGALRRQLAISLQSPGQGQALAPETPAAVVWLRGLVVLKALN